MKVLINQIVIESKLFYRDLTSVFWTFLFPAILMILIGWFFSGSTGKELLHVYDQDFTVKSINFVNKLKNAQDIEVKIITSDIVFQSKIKKNRGELILVIPKGYEKKNDEIILYYNLAYGMGNEKGISILYQSLFKINQELSNDKPIFKIKKINLGGLKVKNDTNISINPDKLTYIDFLCPGIIAMSIMSTCLFGIGITISSYREKGKLRRLALTPLKKSVFILAHIIHRYFVVLIQAGILVVLAYYIFNINIFGAKTYKDFYTVLLDVFSLILVITIGLLTFIAIGFMVVSRVRKSDTAAAIANLIFFPMLLLGGVYFTLDNIPESLQIIVDILPLSHLTEALRHVINYGEPFYNLLDHLLAQIGVMIFCFIVSVKTFIWE